MQSYHPPYFSESARLSQIEAAFPEIDAMLSDYAEKNHFPGYAFGIILDGKLVHSATGGFLDLDKKTPVTAQSMFRIASMTKSFTAMAILQLRDEGKLKLDDPISLYLPQMENQRLTGDAPPIAIRDLLVHSAGFPTDDPWGDRKLDEWEEEFSAFLKEGLFFSNASGTTFEYSNLGYAMLGLIIEKAAGVPYGLFIQERIWKPLGMEDASWDYTEVPDSQLARGHRWIDGKWKEEAMLKSGVFGAMGGMIASIEAMVPYMALHLSAWPPRNEEERGPIQRSSLREMHQPWKFIEFLTDFKCGQGSHLGEGSKSAAVRSYGYGLRRIVDDQGRVFVGHSGGLPGFGSDWIILPEYGVGVVLLTNVTYGPASKMNLEAIGKILEKSQLKPRQLPPSDYLVERAAALIPLLSDWENGEASGIFALNFFLDNSPQSLNQLFGQAGNILSVGPLKAKTQSKGSFLIEGEAANLEVTIWLTPENPPLIQNVQAKLLPH